jgi:hypothetical protein
MLRRLPATVAAGWAPESAERLEFEAPDEYLRRREFLQRAALTAGLTTGLASAFGR